LLVLQAGVRKSACRALPSDVTERVPGLVGAGATQGMSLALDVEGVEGRHRQELGSKFRRGSTGVAWHSRHYRVEYGVRIAKVKEKRELKKESDWMCQGFEKKRE
jgi:hypothetical protein